MIRKNEEYRQLSKTERIRGITIMVAIISAILFLAVIVVMMIFRVMV